MAEKIPTPITDELERVSLSLQTARSIAHQNLGEHHGTAFECTRPVCLRIGQDIAALGEIQRRVRILEREVQGFYRARREG